MNERIEKNKQQEQFEYEKAMFERWGSVNSITFEEWLEIKKGE